MAKDNEIICSRTSTCSFRVHDDYFTQKARFRPGVCPNCGGPLVVVEAFTDNVVPFKVDVDPNSSSYREVIPKPTP